MKLARVSTLSLATGCRAGFPYPNNPALFFSILHLLMRPRGVKPPDQKRGQARAV
jgi:hypothetical protein